MRRSRAVGPYSVAFGLVHARTIVLHPRGRCAPCASFQGEGAYMPTGNVSDDIYRLVERVHVPEPHRRLSCSRQ
jgi:hypothetical protein